MKTTSARAQTLRSQLSNPRPAGPSSLVTPSGAYYGKLPIRSTCRALGIGSPAARGHAVEEHREHDRGHDDVCPVSLEREGEDREGHADQRRRQEHEETELDEAGAIERARGAQDARDSPQVGGLAVEHAIV